MTGNDYDAIAQILKEALRRYPDDGLQNTIRLKGLLTDHLAGLDSEINIVLSAIEEDIAEQFHVAGSAEADISVGRLSQRFEDVRGIRPDIAKSAVLAIGYALGLTGLPSSEVAEISKNIPGGPDLTDDAMANKGDRWEGLSEPVEPNTPPPPQPSKPEAGSGAAGSNMFSQLRSWAKLNPIPSIAIAAGAIMLYFFVSGEQQPPQQQPPQQQPPQQQPQQSPQQQPPQQQPPQQQPPQQQPPQQQPPQQQPPQQQPPQQQPPQQQPPQQQPPQQHAATTTAATTTAATTTAAETTKLKRILRG